MKVRLLVFVSFFATISNAQIAPPGLGGNTTVVSWFALGVQQAIDSSSRWQSNSYLGLGRESIDGEYNPMKNQGILVANEEIQRKIGRQQQISLALSYRRQKEYEEEEFAPRVRQEVRIYSKYGFNIPINKTKLSFGVREEFRKFYTTDFRFWPDESLAFRTRLKTTIQHKLGSSDRNQLLFGVEALLSTSYNRTENTWKPFAYSETRLTAFYSFKPKNARCTFSLGYMDDILVSQHHVNNVGYLSLDVVFNGWKNVFGKR